MGQIFPASHRRNLRRASPTVHGTAKARLRNTYQIRLIALIIRRVKYHVALTIAPESYRRRASPSYGALCP